ncbi:MAG: hypothetical protein JWN70_2395 [Planctomycetaceae bacterium]|nr:hypothetical protein [Planctomycetaceae bacterium]
MESNRKCPPGLKWIGGIYRLQRAADAIPVPASSAVPWEQNSTSAPCCVVDYPDRCVRDAEVAGSNPVTPIRKSKLECNLHQADLVRYGLGRLGPLSGPLNCNFPLPISLPRQRRIRSSSSRSSWPLSTILTFDQAPEIDALYNDVIFAFNAHAILRWKSFAVWLALLSSGSVQVMGLHQQPIAVGGNGFTVAMLRPIKYTQNDPVPQLQLYLAMH